MKHPIDPILKLNMNAHTHSRGHGIPGWFIHLAVVLVGCASSGDSAAVSTSQATTTTEAKEVEPATDQTSTELAVGDLIPGTYNFSDTLRATVGVRTTKDEKESAPQSRKKKKNRFKRQTNAVRGNKEESSKCVIQ